MKKLCLTLVLAAATAFVVPLTRADLDSNGKAVLITSLLPPMPMTEARLVLHNAGSEPVQASVRTVNADGAIIEDLGTMPVGVDKTIWLDLNTSSLAAVRSLVRSKKGEPRVTSTVFCLVRLAGLSTEQLVPAYGLMTEVTGGAAAGEEGQK